MSALPTINPEAAAKGCSACHGGYILGQPCGFCRPPIATVQEALRKFSRMVAARWVFDEASVALDAGCDYKLTITVTEKGNGYIVAMNRHQAKRLGQNSHIKLTHGEWENK